MKQILLNESFRDHKVHGGELVKGKRKGARPIATKRCMHVVMRSSMAKGKLSMHTEARKIEEMVDFFAKRFGIQVREFSNNGNHLHLLVKAETRDGFKRFLMAISGRIAQLMTRATKGVAQVKKFWDHIPFTRIVEWGRDFLNTERYVIQNLLEANRLIPYQARSYTT